MSDQDQPTQQGPHPLVEQIDQTLKHFTPDIMGRTVYCHLDKRGVGQKKCFKVRFPVPFDPEDRRPTMTDYMNAAADHIVGYHPELFAALPELTSGAEVARARQQVQDREDVDFQATRSQVKGKGARALRREEREEDLAMAEAEPDWSHLRAEAVHELRPRLRVAEEVSLDDLMTDPETHARIESEASLPDDIVRAGVQAYERVHPHDRDDAEIIVRKVAAAALLAREKTREADEQKDALARYVADQTHITQLLGFLVADEGVYVYRFVDRAQRRIFDYAPPELRGMILSAVFKVLPQEGTSLVILRDHTPPELLPGPKERDLVVDTLPTVLQVLFGELHSDLTPPGKDGIYVIAVHPDLLARIDGGDPDAEPPATTEATQEGS